MKMFGTALSTGGIGILMLLSGPASAYICTGAGNSLEDVACDADEISVGLLGEPFGGILLAKDDDPANPGEGIGGSTAYGTLEITQFTSAVDGTVEFTYTGLTPQVIIEKADGWYSVYDWDTQINFDGVDTYSFTREFGTFDCSAQGITCGAETSHVDAYGVVPIPAAVWLFGSGLLGLATMSRRARKS